MVYSLFCRLKFWLSVSAHQRCTVEQCPNYKPPLLTSSKCVKFMKREYQMFVLISYTLGFVYWYILKKKKKDIFIMVLPTLNILHLFSHYYFIFLSHSFWGFLFLRYNFFHIYIPFFFLSFAYFCLFLSPISVHNICLWLFI